MKSLKRLNGFPDCEALMYFVVLAYLRPKGFSEIFGWYKKISLLWMMAAMGLVMFLLLKNIRSLYADRQLVYTFIYFAVFIALTLYNQGGIGEGLQKMIMAPFLFVFADIEMKKDYGRFLRVLSTSLLLLLALNLTVFSPLVIKSFSYSAHLCFFGHVQTVAQIGLLSIFVGCLIYRDERMKSLALIAMSVVTMAISETDAAVICVLLVFFALVLFAFRLRGKLAWVTPRVMMGIYLAANFLLLAVRIPKEYWGGRDLSLNARIYIWDEVLALFYDRKLTGYGAYGIQMKMFWGKSMNYAHNETAQKLIDGGLLLLAAFLAMIYAYIKIIGRMRSTSSRFTATIFMLTFFFVMFFESVTEYNYFYIFLTVLPFMDGKPEKSASAEWRKL